MRSKLEEIVEALDNIDERLSPVAYGDARERLLVGGLHALAENFGKEIEFTHIDAKGDMKFNVTTKNEDGRIEYGDGLSQVVSTVSHRTGVNATDAELLPENNWCWINHFEVEKLLKNAVEVIYNSEGNQPPSPGM